MSDVGKETQLGLIDFFFLFPVQLFHSLHHIRPASGVKHGGRLVQYNALGFQGNDARNGHTLLLPAGEQMGGVLPVFVHTNLL